MLLSVLGLHTGRSLGFPAVLYITLPYPAFPWVQRRRDLGDKHPWVSRNPTAQPRERSTGWDTSVGSGRARCTSRFCCQPSRRLTNQGRMVNVFLDIRAICSHKVGLSKTLILCSRCNLLKKLLIVTWQNLSRYLFLEKLAKIL